MVKKIIKSILWAISWIGFFIAVVAAASTVICTISGVAAVIAAVFDRELLNVISRLAHGYFSSITILVVVSMLCSLYELIVKERK